MKTEHPEPSAEYLAALETSRKASREFDKARNAYRSREIGDAEFLAARKAYITAEKAFDAAFAKERERVS